MTHTKIILRVFIATALLLIGQMLFAALCSSLLGPVWPESPDPSTLLPPMFLGQLLIVLALLVPTRTSTLSKGPLFWSLFSAIFGLGVFLTQIEAAVFLVMPRDQLFFGALHGTLQALWTAGWMVALFAPAADKDHSRDSRQSLWGLPFAGWWHRLALSSVAYFGLYFLAGLVIYPQIEAFYSTQTIPSLPILIGLQLTRGTLYVLFVSSVLLNLKLTRRQASLAMVLMFPMLAGVATLLAPNAIMPDAVRFWHILEIGLSNALFGALVGYLFAPPANLSSPKRNTLVSTGPASNRPASSSRAIVDAC